jgi:hypothetical protein
MISEPGLTLTLTLYAAEPASPTAHALDLLASWTAARRRKQRPRRPEFMMKSPHSGSVRELTLPAVPGRPGDWRTRVN